ncbi:hypothetical protein LP419_10955 [Massilia sp. H-1]|nr:hypothetical protein LP419_10955 [Massilia sp. H-1]
MLKDTASMVLKSGIFGLSFIDEADAVNQVMPELRQGRPGVRAHDSRRRLHQGTVRQARVQRTGRARSSTSRAASIRPFA